MEKGLEYNKIDCLSCIHKDVCGIASLNDAINLSRLKGGIFDTANFDQTSYNRVQVVKI